MKHEFQQFEIEKTERTKEEGGNVHRRKRHPNTCVVDKGGLNLQSIDEEGEDGGSQAPSMAKSEHRNSFNQSGSCEEIRDNTTIKVSF